MILSTQKAGPEDCFFSGFGDSFLGFVIFLVCSVAFIREVIFEKNERNEAEVEEGVLKDRY